MNQFAERLGGFWRGNGGQDDPGRWLRLGGIGLAVLWVLSGLYIVAPDEQGVVTRFGRYVVTTDSGLNYHLPWPVERVQKVPVTRENVTEIGFRSARGGVLGSSLPSVDVPEESMMLTGDENIVDLDFSVRWRIAAPEKFLFNVADPETTVAAVAESVMRETIGRHPIDDALADAKVRIQQEARQHLQAVLDYYRIGVQVTGVELQRVNPPSEVIDAFRDVQAARADAEKLINEAQGYANQILPEARGQAAQVLQNAEGYKTATIAAAEGDAARFNAQVGAYKANPGVVRDRLYLETMQGVLSGANKVVVTGKGGNLLPFLPLDRMAPSAANKPDGSTQGGQ